MEHTVPREDVAALSVRVEKYQQAFLDDFGYFRTNAAWHSLGHVQRSLQQLGPAPGFASFFFEVSTLVCSKQT